MKNTRRCLLVAANLLVALSAFAFIDAFDPTWFAPDTATTSSVCTNCVESQPIAVLTNPVNSGCSPIAYAWYHCSIYGDGGEYPFQTLWTWTNSTAVIRVYTSASTNGLYDVYTDCTQLGASTNNVPLTCSTNGFLCGTVRVSDGMGNDNDIIFGGCP